MSDRLLVTGRHAARIVRVLPLAACVALAACGRGGAANVAAHWDVVETVCGDCHNEIDRAGDLVLDNRRPEDVGRDAAVWEHALRMLRGDLMPPPSSRGRLTRAQRDEFVAALEHALDEAAREAGPRPGYVGLHRLNRTEYQNAVRDLLGLRIDAAELLPSDNTKAGYDKVADVLTVSPTFLEQYVAAARRVAVAAVGDANASPSSVTYVPETSASGRRHREGLPLGTRGGLVVTHDFPADGEYRINVADMAGALWVTNMEFENTLVVTLDGREIYRTTIGGEEDQRAIDQNGVSASDRINSTKLRNIAFDATAGQHEVAVAFLARTYAETDGRLAARGGENNILSISSFEIQGPFNPTGVSDSPSRRKIFSCRPEPGAAPEAVEACALRTIERLARRAYRRPVSDDEVAGLMTVYAAGYAHGGYDAGVRRALSAMLASPAFLYRFASPSDATPGSLYTLDDYQLASRLSFFLWSSIPDDELLDVAESGQLREPRVLDAQVRRMLADERARVLVSDFAFQWLDMSSLDDVEPDSLFGGDPRDAYRRELELFLRSILLEDRSVIDLLTADHTYVNETFAALYDLEGVYGDQFRRIVLDDPARHGLLGKGAILMATSYPNRTAPVLRGKFILDNIVGSPPSPPPPEVNTDLIVDDGGPARTIRDRFAEHRANPACASCHEVMDPLGFALENFNAIGQWRSREAGREIDASGTLASGEPIDGPLDLRRALVAEPERFARTLTEELMIYALGRSLEYTDMPVVREIVAEAAKSDYRFSALITGIVRSDAFRMIEVPAAQGESAPAGAVTASAGPSREGHRDTGDATGSSRPGHQPRG